jgi:uncharacterized membrane protein
VLTWLLAAAQWLHILAAIFWFGSAMTVDLIIVPALRSLPADGRRAWLQPFNPRYARVVGPAGGVTILLGIIRGLLGGVWGSLTSPYGLTFLAAIVISIAVAIIGARLIAPAAERIAASTDLAEIEAQTMRLSNLGKLEMVGFLVLFTMMIAMRFGY